MSRVFIHVGLPKTASTFLQYGVFPQLTEHFLVSRPYTQENPAFNTLQYADDSLYDRARVELELGRIRTAAGSRDLLLSDENFSGLSIYNFINRGFVAARLAAVLPDAEIILFLRGQGPIIASLHNQLVKMGWYLDEIGPSYLAAPGPGTSLEEYRAGALGWSTDRRFINHWALMNVEHFCYTDLVRLYERLFPRVHLFLFEDLRARPRAVLDRLGALLGAPAALVAPAEDVNPGLAGEDLVVQLLRNRMTKFPGPRLARALPGVARAVARIRGPRIAERQARYLQQTIAGSRIARDNVELERRYGLGLGQYPDAYPMTDQARSLREHG